MSKVSVLNISSGDLIGSRFNGYDWHDDFIDHGIISKMLVGWNHDSEVDWVEPISQRRSGSFLKARDRTVYQNYLSAGLESGSYPWAKKIFDHPWYIEADVIHLQIIHDGTLDFTTIKRIIKEKPTVWTWHDPWPLTGHCIYPMDCNRWAKGCGECPDLDRAFQIKKDNSRNTRVEKRDLIDRNYVLHVASNWFANLIESDKTAKTPVPNILPFGLKNFWASMPDPSESRRLFGIPDENFVLGIRSVSEPQKNFELFQNALRRLPPDLKLTIISLQNLGALDEFKSQYQVIELPWTNDNKILSKFFTSLDLFIMPSRWETFGLMALEAMSYGVPVVGLQNTATSEVCDLENNGFLIENNSESLSSILLKCYLDPSITKNLYARNVNFLSNERNYENFLKGMSNLYRKAIEDFQS
jgi:glycosyltransferase involved in cell wall biosynthesis